MSNEIFAASNRVGIGRVKETVWGETPANPVFKQTRYTGESLTGSISTETSQEMRDDRMTSDLVVVDGSPSGDINIEMSYGSYDDLIESAMMSTFSSPLAIVGDAGDIEASVTDGGFVSTTGNKFLNVAVGQWIRVAGFTNPGNNGFFRVTAKPGNDEITVSPAPAADEAPAGAAVSITGSLIRNGTTLSSYTLQKRFNDLTPNVYHRFRGMRVGTMEMSMETGSILTGSFGFVGRDDDMSEDALSGVSYEAAPTTQVMNAVTSVRNVLQGGLAVGAGGLMSMSLTLDNSMREQKGIGVLGNVGVSPGTLNVTGDASLYFQDGTQYQKFKDADGFLLSFRMQDLAGNALVVTLPNCKYESMEIVAGGLDQDVMAESSYRAVLDPVTNCMIQIDRFPAA